ncbi:MAG: hypothetical protein WBP12_02570 [Candidatus Saccharimonas sp.]
MSYKQQSNQGCLVVDLLHLFGIQPTREREQTILGDGLFRLRENYALGCLMSFLDHYKNLAVEVYVDNNYYLGVLQKYVNHPHIHLLHKKNDARLLGAIDPPFIVYVDNNIFDGWTHLPHFVLVTKATQNFYHVFDPWDGETHMVSKEKLLSGINQLRSHVKVCPLIIVSCKS